MLERLSKAEEFEPRRGNEEFVTRNLLFAIAHGLVATIERLEMLLADDIFYADTTKEE
jgi:hypothetical protein